MVHDQGSAPITIIMVQTVRMIHLFKTKCRCNVRFIRRPPRKHRSQSQQGQGTGDESSRDDHTHYLPHDSTLAFSSGSLGVSIHDVVEHLSQRIQYYTNENNYDTDGSGAGQVYDSSRYPKNLQWVKAFIRVPLGVDDAIYRLGSTGYPMIG